MASMGLYSNFISLTFLLPITFISVLFFLFIIGFFIVRFCSVASSTPISISAPGLPMSMILLGSLLTNLPVLLHLCSMLVIAIRLCLRVYYNSRINFYYVVCSSCLICMLTWIPIKIIRILKSLTHYQVPEWVWSNHNGKLQRRLIG